MAIQHPNGPHAIARPRRAVARPEVFSPAPETRCLTLGAAMATARHMTTRLLSFIHLQAHGAAVTIAGDTRRGWEEYYIKYGKDIHRFVTSQAAVAWLVEHDSDMALGEWDVTVCPRADNLTTLI